ncbi:hypothetical protein PanWU01x14_064180 [Parasponia andersonii]|uniref:Uncharacterized protein n=1 Tax=Parasponia andersonii TaxID=3476 RepID=A0A2P5DH71_PARAD|nr:hypothetical protein PanWU01x14_064180 [Parasponia andersonii]
MLFSIRETLSASCFQVLGNVFNPRPAFTRNTGQSLVILMAKSLTKSCILTHLVPTPSSMRASLSSFIIACPLLISFSLLPTSSINPSAIQYCTSNSTSILYFSGNNAQYKKQARDLSFFKWL